MAITSKEKSTLNTLQSALLKPKGLMSELELATRKKEELMLSVTLPNSLFKSRITRYLANQNKRVSVNRILKNNAEGGQS